MESFGNRWQNKWTNRLLSKSKMVVLDGRKYGYAAKSEGVTWNKWG